MTSIKLILAGVLSDEWVGSFSRIASLSLSPFFKLGAFVPVELSIVRPYITVVKKLVFSHLVCMPGYYIYNLTN